MNSIGRINTNYNTAVLASDAESIRSSYLSPTSFPLKRVIYGLMQFVNEVPTSNDPEYTAGNIPLVYSLSQNYPNPFNPSTKISFSLPVSGLVTLKIYDMLGQEVMNAVNEVKEAGKYEVEINAGYLASGMYFYKLNSGEFTETRKMLLLK
ncbi:MAG: T9SS type A sorting domain-containing protein [Ignavibacteria bacterium]|nr:T9SS type A sorting domain-containing protein [Ignavibacteria bacterium]